MLNDTRMSLDEVLKCGSKHGDVAGLGDDQLALLRGLGLGGSAQRGGQRGGGADGWRRT